VFEEPRDALFLLQRWYVQQCNDEWEHSYGVRIDTLDNPGWTFVVDLVDTAHASTTRDWSRVERSEHDWVHWRVHEDRFEAACGPTNLNEAILAFLDLVEARAQG
jgi:hypothetical protein